MSASTPSSAAPAGSMRSTRPCRAATGAGQQLGGGQRIEDGVDVWESEDERHRYQVQGDLATGATLLIDNRVSVKGFRNGDLGITLADAPAPPPVADPPRTYVLPPDRDEVEVWKLPGGAEGYTVIGDGRDNRLVGDSGADVLIGATGSDHLWGDARFHTLDVANHANDWIRGRRVIQEEDMRRDGIARAARTDRLPGHRFGMYRQQGRKPRVDRQARGARNRSMTCRAGLAAPVGVETKPFARRSTGADAPSRSAARGGGA